MSFWSTTVLLLQLRQNENRLTGCLSILSHLCLSFHLNILTQDFYLTPLQLRSEHLKHKCNMGRSLHQVPNMFINSSRFIWQTLVLLAFDYLCVLIRNVTSCVSRVGILYCRRRDVTYLLILNGSKTHLWVSGAAIINGPVCGGSRWTRRGFMSNTKWHLI